MKLYNKIIIIALFIGILIGVGSCQKNITYDVRFIDDISYYERTYSYEKNERVRKPDDPEVDGYIFLGWYFKES